MTGRAKSTDEHGEWPALLGTQGVEEVRLVLQDVLEREGKVVVVIIEVACAAHDLGRKPHGARRHASMRHPRQRPELLVELAAEELRSYGGLIGPHFEIEDSVDHGALLVFDALFAVGGGVLRGLGLNRRAAFSVVASLWRAACTHSPCLAWPLLSSPRLAHL